jgi:hypothetical protein
MDLRIRNDIILKICDDSDDNDDGDDKYAEVLVMDTNSGLYDRGLVPGKTDLTVSLCHLW